MKRDSVKICSGSTCIEGTGEYANILLAAFISIVLIGVIAYAITR